MPERPMKRKLGKYMQTTISAKNITHTNNQHNVTDLYQKIAAAWQDVCAYLFAARHPFLLVHVLLSVFSFYFFCVMSGRKLAD